VQRWAAQRSAPFMKTMPDQCERIIAIRAAHAPRRAARNE
jgi:hypothetical protein